MKKLPLFIISSFFFFFLLLSSHLQAQVNLLKAEEFIITANINLANDELETTKSNSSAKIELQNGELDITFPLEKSVNKQFYNISLYISLDGQTLSPIAEELKGFHGTKLTSEQSGVKRITWMNLVDTYKQLEGQLEVKVNVELRGVIEYSIDCNNPPVFTKKQKMPYYIAGGVGIVAIAAGQLFKNRSQEIYDDEYLTSETLAEAQPKYDDANSNHHAYLILTYAGSAIIATDLVMYLIRNGRYKKRLKIHQKICDGKSLTVSPMIQIPTSSSSPGASGVRLSLSF